MCAADDIMYMCAANDIMHMCASDDIIYMCAANDIMYMCAADDIMHMYYIRHYKPATANALCTCVLPTMLCICTTYVIMNLQLQAALCTCVLPTLLCLTNERHVERVYCQRQCVPVNVNGSMYTYVADDIMNL